MKVKIVNFWLAVGILILWSWSVALVEAAGPSFKQQQLRYVKVRKAYQEKECYLQQLFQSKGLDYPPKRLFFRIFKKEKIFQVWIASGHNSKYILLKEYPICRVPGRLGPKRREGDFQMPEGFYFINRFNPTSNYYLSLGLNYPNKSDAILGVKGHLGGNIFIHGGCSTVGCIPMTNDLIMEIYVLAVEARNNGQKRIPVFIFPMKLTEQNLEEIITTNDRILRYVVHLIEQYPSLAMFVPQTIREHLRQKLARKEALWRFWSNLKEGYDIFEKTHTLPYVTVRKDGSYAFKQGQGKN